MIKQAHSRSRTQVVFVCAVATGPADGCNPARASHPDNGNGAVRATEVATGGFRGDVLRHVSGVGYADYIGVMEWSQCTAVPYPVPAFSAHMMPHGIIGKKQLIYVHIIVVTMSKS